LTTEVESLKATIEQMGKVAADTIDLLTKERNEALTTMARDERAGVASETEPLAGTTGVAEAHRIAVRYWQREAKEARDTLVDFQIASHKALRDAGDEIARLRAIYIGRDKVVWRLRLERDDVRIRLAERDAQVTRLTKRLSEGLG